MDEKKVAHNLTLQEYVIFRQIKQNGEWSAHDLYDIKRFDMDAFESLKRKGLILKSENYNSSYHPCAEADTIMIMARNLLGISSL